ncbi:hypothetical protein [Streptomyces sp. B21-083]
MSIHDQLRTGHFAAPAPTRRIGLATRAGAVRDAEYARTGGG